MLATDLTLDNADSSDVTYRLTSQDSTGSRRIDIASSMSLPSLLSIRHSVTGKAPNQVDRHLVQLNKSVASSLGSVPVTANFTLAVPRDVAVTNQIVLDMVSNLIDLLSDSTLTGLTNHSNLDAILRGES